MIYCAWTKRGRDFDVWKVTSHCLTMPDRGEHLQFGKSGWTGKPMVAAARGHYYRKEKTVYLLQSRWNGAGRLTDQTRGFTLGQPPGGAFGRRARIMRRPEEKLHGIRPRWRSRQIWEQLRNNPDIWLKSGKKSTGLDLEKKNEHKLKTLRTAREIHFAYPAGPF